MPAKIFTSALLSLTFCSGGRFPVCGQTALPASPQTRPAAAAGQPIAENPVEEIKQALAMLDGRNWHRVLKKLIEERIEFDCTPAEIAGFRERLPFNITRDNRIHRAKSERLNRLAQKVFDLHRVENREVIVFTGRKPIIATWKGYYILVSSGAADNLTAEELTGLIAHEVAHFYFNADLWRAFYRKNDRAARLVELQSDAVAILMLKQLNLKPTAYHTALEKIIRIRREQSFYDDIEPLHPSLAARQELSKQLIGLIEQAAEKVVK